MQKDFQAQLRSYRGTRQLDWGSEQFYLSTAAGRKGQGHAAAVAAALCLVSAVGGLAAVSSGDLDAHYCMSLAPSAAALNCPGRDA